MSEYSDFDTAVEIMAYKMANCVKKAEQDSKYEEELKKLRDERDRMYAGDKKIIKKILNIYSKDIKKIYENL